MVTSLFMFIWNAAGPVELFTECNYNGAVYRLLPGDYDSPRMAATGVPSNMIKSIRMPAGYEVTVFDTGLLNSYEVFGQDLTFTESIQCMDKIVLGGDQGGEEVDFNDRISSLKICSKTPSKCMAWNASRNTLLVH